MTAGDGCVGTTAERKVEVEPNDDDIDPQIQELCDYFNIEACFFLGDERTNHRFEGRSGMLGDGFGAFWAVFG